LYSLKVKSYLNNTSKVGNSKVDNINNKNVEVQIRSKKTFNDSKIFLKEKSGETAPLTSIYWDTIFAATNPDIRLNHLIQDNSLRSAHFLPSFVNYYDYNFNNAQAIKSFEDIV
jgi:hypothetical protein